jgi:serine/threonine-protein kinase
MIVHERQPITKKEPAQPGDLQDGVLHVPLTFSRMIGAGGMGEVWEATSDDLPGHRFAVKVIASAHVQNRDVIARFFGEARAASAIDDPNIVMIHGTGRTADGRPALVMPYIEGSCRSATRLAAFRADKSASLCPSPGVA